MGSVRRVRALRTFVVAGDVPPALAPLASIAGNLGWISDERVQDLFRRIDPERWDADAPDPRRFLAHTPPKRLAELAADSTFTALAADVLDALERATEIPAWFQQEPRAADLVAYFSPEFGIADGLPQYSGGLGILAGDHLKAASDLGVPLVGVGLFYRHGYFTQTLDDRGWQHERFPRLRPEELPLRPIADATVVVDLGGREVVLAMWEAVVGRTHLYLLDSDRPENDPRDRAVTDRLYGGDAEQRIRQEIALGIGGVRALDALGLAPSVFHMNEGHAGFLALERIRKVIVADGLSLDEAIEATRPATVFTTHTPVPAGIDRFARPLVEQYFAAWAEECGTTVDRLLELGHEPGTEPGEELNLAVLGLRLSGAANGVSRLHGDVSRRMFGGLWPDLEPGEVPIGSVTNGVHAPTWVAPALADVFSRAIGNDWADAAPERFAALEDLPDEAFWALRLLNRQRLVDAAREHTRRAGRARGRRGSELTWIDDMLDPATLTIGFARRFAPYKRATLLLRRPERLRRLLSSADRPVQMVFAGKAHPADDAGKESLRRIAELAADFDVRRRFVFLEDYSIGVAQLLYHGCDVWLNNPRRPMEACGTSGMKAALNGALNCSVLDGWWDEMFDGEAGWAIPSFEWITDADERDDREADALYSLLENEIVPLFYDRGADGVPAEWIRRSKAAITRLGPAVSAGRMVREYVERYYEPAARAAARLSADRGARARDLAAWKSRVRREWAAVAVVDASGDGGPLAPGASRPIEAVVALGALAPDDVEVRLLSGPVDGDDAIETATVERMQPAGAVEGGAHRFRGVLSGAAPGVHGFTIMVLPSHPDLMDDHEMGLTAWACPPGGPPERPVGAGQPA
jgi:starch phosphorylase